VIASKIISKLPSKNNLSRMIWSLKKLYKQIFKIRVSIWTPLKTSLTISLVRIKHYNKIFKVKLSSRCLMKVSKLKTTNSTTSLQIFNIQIFLKWWTLMRLNSEVSNLLELTIIPATYWCRIQPVIGSQA